MRLLHTKLLVFKEFFDEQVPPCTILSHRWGESEVSYQDFQAAVKENSFSQERYWKILKCCSMSAGSGYDWTWIDTCSINKESSAELTEAVNSMFKWYQQADVCYAYLFDVIWEWEPASSSEWRAGSVQLASSRDSFRQSQWFTRGWTLQELLAPRHVYFFASRWHPIGVKDDLTEDIAAATRVDTKYLLQTVDITEASVAQRMCWASRRKSTRLEDTAYCLLGLFDVNMPLLYGEGRKAFMRLQLEILKKDDDETIFAWTSKNQHWRGLLAPFPYAFENSHDVALISKLPGDRLPYAMTNKGLQFRLNMSREDLEKAKGDKDRKGQILLTLVNCRTPEDAQAPPQHIDILIQESNRPVPYHGVDYWERVDNTRLGCHPFKYDHAGPSATLEESNTTVIYHRQDGL
jgi:hypothetical protein